MLKKGPEPSTSNSAVGLLFDYPTVVVPGSRQGRPKDIYLMTRAQVRPKEDDVRPKVVDVRSSPLITLYVRSAPLA